jgi:hypothetical protein
VGYSISPILSRVGLLVVKTIKKIIMSTQKEKKEHWSKIGIDFVNKTKAYGKISFDWSYKDSEYYHPMVDISDKIHLVAQCDMSCESPYGLKIAYKNNGEMKPHGSISVDFEWQYLDNILVDVNGDDSVCKKIMDEIENLESFKRDIDQRVNDLKYMEFYRQLNENKFNKEKEKLTHSIQGLVFDLTNL